MAVVTKWLCSQRSLNVANQTSLHPRGNSSALDCFQLRLSDHHMPRSHRKTLHTWPSANSGYPQKIRLVATPLAETTCSSCRAHLACSALCPGAHRCFFFFFRILTPPTSVDPHLACEIRSGWRLRLCGTMGSPTLAFQHYPPATWAGEGASPCRGKSPVSQSSLASVCAPRVASWCLCTSFCQDCALTAGLTHRQVQSLRGERSPLTLTSPHSATRTHSGTLIKNTLSEGLLEGGKRQNGCLSQSRQRQCR